MMGTVVGQYRRLVSTCVIRAQAQCLVSRVGIISPAARDAARRREVAGRLGRQHRQEMRSQWMASFVTRARLGPGRELPHHAVTV